MLKFKHDYLVFDEFGINRVLCMSCGTPIKSRSEIRSKIDTKVIIRELSKHNEYREVPVLLDGNKLAFIMICVDCKDIPIGEIESQDISRQLRDALRMQLEHEGKLVDLINEIIKQNSYRVLRKAEPAEVVAAIGGMKK